jgi:outer membrane protein assembly factor BamB
MVRAYDARSGRLSWADRVDDGDRVGQAESLSLAADGRVYATGGVGCNPETFVEGKLALRAYDSRSGLVWKRTLAARGGDWGFPLYVAAAGDRVFFGGGELLEDGQCHGVIRAFAANNGASLWREPFDEGSDPPGNLILSVIRDRLFVGGIIFCGPDFSSDFVLRRYRSR